MYGQTEDQEKQKKKIIIASLVMGTIIIILIGVLISAIASKNKARLAEQQATETAVIREDTKQEPSKTNTSKTAEDEKLDPVANPKEEKTAVVTPSSDVKDNLPQTGAGSILGLALFAGSATTYVFSKRK